MVGESLLLLSIIERHAQDTPDAAALLGEDAPPLTYAAFRQLMDEAAQALAGWGVVESDRVALVTANGPAAASSFMAVASCCGCAPLNPSYREEEFRFYLEDLSPSLLLVERGVGQAALAAAAASRIPVRHMDPEPARGAGWFTLETGTRRPEARFAAEESIALYLHTSGTTSRPKLVPLTQRNLACSASNVAQTLNLGPEDRCLNVMPLFHIHGLVAAVLASLSAGASVVCTPGFQVTRFFDWLDEFVPTWYTAVPTMHQAIAGRAVRHPGQAARARLRFVRSSSASLPPSVLSQIEEIFGSPMVEAYGMTEAAHQMASNPLPPLQRKPGSVGLAAGPEVAIMDEAGGLVAQGGRGEVVIRGPNVATGYVANEEANRKAYDNGWFRTGDEGYFDAEGYLYLTGRLKEMINRGGEKIAPREIDEALMEHPAIAQAVAFGLPDVKLGEEVAAAVVLRKSESVSEADLQDFLAGRLSDFKVPRRIVFVDEIPKGATGKLQRIGLATRLGITSVRSESSTSSEAAPTALICQMTRIFEEVLRRGDVAERSNFFDLGGDSILAAQAMARANAVTGLAFNVMHLFRAPTPAALAGLIHAAGPDGPRLPATACGYARSPHLSPAQERMLFLHDYEEERAVYNRPALLRLRGEVDEGALRAALDDLTARHEAFRTHFERTPSGWAAVISGSADCKLDSIDLRNSAAAETEVTHFARRFFTEPFELEQAPLLRVALLRVQDDEWRLAVSMHHSVSDGWSSRVFFRDLANAYAARASGAVPVFEPVGACYGDYVSWLDHILAGPTGTNLEQYWREHLEGAPPLLDLPTDRPRPALETFGGSYEALDLSSTLTASLRDLARAEQATLFMVLLAGFQCLLARISGITDIVIGTPVAGRLRPEFESLIGLFVNTVALRCNLSGNPRFREVLSQAREATVGAIAHQELPFERLVEILKVQRSLSYAPVVQVMFQLRNVPIDRVSIAGCNVEEMEVDPGLVPMDLSLEAAEDAGRLRCRLYYRTDLYRRETARTLLEGYRCLLESAAAEPELRLGMLELRADGQEDVIRGEVREVAAPVPYAILKAAEAHPEKVAIICAGRSLTYAEYRRLAFQTTSALQAAGVAPGSRVAVMAGRRAEIPAWLLGVWLAGCSHVPIDPANSPERAEFMMRDSGIAALLAESTYVNRMGPRPFAVIEVDKITKQPAEAVEPALDDESPACVIYTSGSTGVPKGVELLHGALRNVLDWQARLTGVGTNDVFVNVSSFAFDMSFFDFHLAPAIGATVVIAGEAEVLDGQLLGELLEKSGCTYLNATPTTYSMLLQSGWRGSERLCAVTGGEALVPTVAEELLKRIRVLYNLYGPTETTDCVTGDRLLSAGPPVSLGRPVTNTSLCILDGWGRPALAGFPGELLIGGIGVARGYVNRPELTAERFVALETSAGRVAAYRTGDMVRSLPDGGIEFLGRTDHQVKLRGYRIELGDVESALGACPGVRAAAVVLQSDPVPRLAAYYTGADLPETHPRELRAALRRSLPEYMIPSVLCRLDSLPLTSNGKVDRKTLATLAVGQDGLEALPVRPLTRTEAEVAELFTELLARKEIGARDNFFDLGGHSLLVVRLLNRIKALFGQKLEIREFFANPTVEATAAAIEAAPVAYGTRPERPDGQQ